MLNKPIVYMIEERNGKKYFRSLTKEETEDLE